MSRQRIETPMFIVALAMLLFQAHAHTATPDTDCLENNANYYGGSRLPLYWETLADARNINTSLLGFNVAAGKWCYDGTNTCVQWGEFNDVCDDALFACGGHETTPQTIGTGSIQMGLIASAISRGDHRHFRCPVCTDNARGPCPSGASRGTEDRSTATFTDCDCVRHFTGRQITPDGFPYWWGAAASWEIIPRDGTGLSLTFLDNMWFHFGRRTCVGKGSHQEACDDSVMFCAGSSHGSPTYGSRFQQMSAVHSTGYEAGGVHWRCPSS